MTSNTPKHRNSEAIVLGPIINVQGAYKFMNLNTGQLIKRGNFNELPMPESVRKKVEK